MITASCHKRLSCNLQVRTTHNGNAMCTVFIARDVAPCSAEEETMAWVSIYAFGQAREALARYHNGDCIGVTGKLSLRAWIDTDGSARQGWQMVADAPHSSRTAHVPGRASGLPRGRRMNVRERSDARRSGEAECVRRKAS